MTEPPRCSFLCCPVANALVPARAWGTSRLLREMDRNGSGLEKRNRTNVRTRRNKTWGVAFCWPSMSYGFESKTVEVGINQHIKVDIWMHKMEERSFIKFLNSISSKNRKGQSPTSNSSPLFNVANHFYSQLAVEISTPKRQRTHAPYPKVSPRARANAFETRQTGFLCQMDFKFNVFWGMIIKNESYDNLMSYVMYCLFHYGLLCFHGQAEGTIKVPKPSWIRKKAAMPGWKNDVLEPVVHLRGT